MRLLVVTAAYPPAVRGGYELACEAVVGELAARGHAARILTSPAVHHGGEAPTRPEPTVERTLRWTFDPARKPWAVPRWDLWVPGNPSTVLAAAASFAPDVIYVWNLSGLGVLTVLRAVSSTGRPALVHLMDYWLAALIARERDGRPRFHPLARPLLNPLLAAVARSVKRSLERAVLVGMSETVVAAHAAAGLTVELLRHGVPVAPQPPSRALPRPAGAPFRALVAGRLIEGKGVHVAVDAVRSLLARGEPIALDIAGAGDDRERLERRIGDASAAIRLLGPLPQHELLARLPGYDAFVFPTLRNEPMGIVVLEAMAAGVPLVSSRIGGPAEVLRHEETAILVPPGDAAALADALARLRREDALRAHLIDRAHADALEHHSLASAVDRVEAALERAAFRSRGGSS